VRGGVSCGACMGGVKWSAGPQARRPGPVVVTATTARRWASRDSLSRLLKCSHAPLLHLFFVLVEVGKHGGLEARTQRLHPGHLAVNRSSFQSNTLQQQARERV